LICAARARAQQQTSRMSLLLSIDGTDRQTDGRTEGHLTVTQTLHWVLSFLSFIDDIDMFVDFICIS